MYLIIISFLIAIQPAFYPSESINVVAMQDGPKKAELVADSLRHDLAGVFYAGESDRSLSVVLTAGVPRGISCSAASAISCLQCKSDSDEESQTRVKLVRLDLAKVKHLRAYKIRDGDVQPAYVIGGDVGGYFVGIRARATETLAF
jgi:hypothetical protein